jgi:hypothetical protein
MILPVGYQDNPEAEGLNVFLKENENKRWLWRNIHQKVEHS